MPGISDTLRFISPYSGDAVARNASNQTIDPWPRYVYDTEHRDQQRTPGRSHQTIPNTAHEDEERLAPAPSADAGKRSFTKLNLNSSTANNQIREIIMASPDENQPEKDNPGLHRSAFVAMAKGAIASSDEQQLTVIQKPVLDLAGEVREFPAMRLSWTLMRLTSQTSSNCRKSAAWLAMPCRIIVISENFSPAAARILIQLKVADFLVKPLQTSDFVRSINNALKTGDSTHQVEPQFLSFMPASGGVGNNHPGA